MSYDILCMDQLCVARYNSSTPSITALMRFNITFRQHPYFHPLFLPRPKLKTPPFQAGSFWG